MRPVRLILALFAALGLSAAAHATPVEITAVNVGERLADKSDEYGERDIERLLSDLSEAVTERLESHGHSLVATDGAVSVTLTLEDAWPNRPTRRQMSDNLGLSFRSISLGGASISAVLHDAAGEVIGELEYSWRTRHISDSVGRPVWHDANRTFDRFAGQLADEIPGEAS